MAFGVLQSHRQTVRLKCNRSVGRFARSTDAFQNSRFLFVATVVDLVSIVERESSLCINRGPDVALGRFNNDARARADAAVMSHVAAVRELDEAVAAAMECEHAVSALKKAVADAKGAHRTSAFASEAVTARGAAEALVAAARRVDAALTAAVVENLSAVRRGFGGSASRARPSPTSPSTVGRRRPSSAPRSPPDRFDVDENPARVALRRQLAELDQRDTVARLTAVPVTTVRLRLTRFRPPATRTSPAVASRVVPFRFARAASPPPGDFDGADALAALLPDMRAKLQLEHVAVVGVYGADGARRASVYDFVDGEVVALKTVADVAASDARDAFATGDSRIDRRDRATPRARAAITVRAVPTSAAVVASRGAGAVSASSSREDAPVSVRIPAASQTPRGALDAVAKAVLASRRSLAPPIAWYAADGTPVEDVSARVRDGDVVLYRCAHHPAPASATAARKQRERDATLAAPKEGHARSFAVVAKIRRRGGESASGAVARPERERELRLPSRGLEAMSTATLRRRIALAFGVEDPNAIARVRVAPGRVELEHPAQLHPGARLTFEMRIRDRKPARRDDEKKGVIATKTRIATDEGTGTRAATRVTAKRVTATRVTARDLRPARPTSAPARPGVGEVGFGATIRFDPARLKSAKVSPVETRRKTERRKTRRRRATAEKEAKMTQEEADGTTVFAETFHAFRDVSADASAAAVGDSTRLDASPLPEAPRAEKKVVDEPDDRRDVGRYLAG